MKAIKDMRGDELESMGETVTETKESPKATSDIFDAEKPQKKTRKKRAPNSSSRTTKQDKLIMRYKAMESTLQILSSGVAIGLNDPVWVITDANELETGGKAWVDALDHYFPGWEKASPGLALLIWAGSYALQRVPKSKFFQKSKEEKKPRSEHSERKNPVGYTIG